MSSAGPVDSQSQPISPQPISPGVALGDAPAQDAAGEIDPQLIEQTKNEIRVLVQEITQLCQSDISADQFYGEFLRRVVQALASHGGAVWTCNEDGQLQLQYQVNLPHELIDAQEHQPRHARLLANALAGGQPTLVPPQSGRAGSEEAGNPLDSLIVLAPLKVEQEPVGVIEVFQRAGGGPTTQRGYLRFLVQMTELAGDYLTNRRLRHLGDRQLLWENLERFLWAIHRHLETQETAYTIVNEARGVIHCDRVSLALRRGRRHRVVAVSGLDAIDRRAEEVRRLGHLATVVAKGRRSIWYNGAGADLAPQIAEPLQSYLDQSHATLLSAIPLYPPADERDAQHSGQGNAAEPAQREPIGTMIVEQLADSRFHEGQQDRIETVARHSAAALTNALEHESLFLMPLWRLLGKAKWVVQARTLPKTVFVLAVLLSAVAALVFVPADFELAARGKLVPVVRRDVFAHTDGVVVELPVQHEQMVEPGDVLARINNNSLEVEIANLIGRKRATWERIQSVQRAQLNARRMSIEEQNRLDGELLELQEVAAGIDRQLMLQQQKQELQTVRAPVAGQVVTWKLKELLTQRPVQRGQSLMTIVDPQGAWELELRMPQRRVGHLARAAREQDELPVTFLLASHPDQQFEGRVVEIHGMAEARGEEGTTVLLRAAIDKTQLPELRSGTSVSAKVGCGRRSIGYVIFHEVIATVQRKVLFWF